VAGAVEHLPLSLPETIAVKKISKIKCVFSPQRPERRSLRRGVAAVK